MLGTSFFDSVATWERDPMVAFESLLASGTYTESSRAEEPINAEYGMRASSAAVYRFMFRRYLTFLACRGVAFHQADVADVQSFMDRELDDVQDGIRKRYGRLLERSYHRARQLGALKANPASHYFVDNTILETRHRPKPVDGQVIDTLQTWFAHSVASVVSGDAAHQRRAWKVARDMVMASVSLGSGLRCVELLNIQGRMVQFVPGEQVGSRLGLVVGKSITTATAEPHRAWLSAACEPVLEAWLGFRYRVLAGWLSEKDRPEGLSQGLLFPGTLKGAPLKSGTLSVNFAKLADLALEEGALEETQDWVLRDGATGLRRAYIVSALQRGESIELLQERLGLKRRSSVERYRQAFGDPRVTTPLAAV